ncbi:MAG: HesA/MoeB/ThiF family protein [Planctomycetota bacterium]
MKLELEEGRYHRQSLVRWWDQERVNQARLLVVGAGALGNEILKNLALMGAGHVLVYDMDEIEASNLSRGVLFREGDEGAAKAFVAARRMRELNPEVRVHAREENLVHRAGLGVFAWADIVICGVDNREARLFVNSACARTGKRWVDGAIEGFAGVVRVFDPHQGPCYECTMNDTDRKLVAERRSCAMLARDVASRGHVPATAVAASVVGALQVQEAFKVLHDQPALLGEGLHLDGLWGEMSRVKYPRRDDCPGHDFLGPVTPLGMKTSDVTFSELLDRAEAELGPGAVLDLSRDVIVSLDCPDCGQSEPGRAVLGAISEREAACPACRTHRIVRIASCIGRDGVVNLAETPADMGIPPLDIMVARQGLEAHRAWLFDGDASGVLGPLVDSRTSGPDEQP